MCLLSDWVIFNSFSQVLTTRHGTGQFFLNIPYLVRLWKNRNILKPLVGLEMFRILLKLSAVP